MLLLSSKHTKIQNLYFKSNNFIEYEKINNFSAQIIHKLSTVVEQIAKKSTCRNYYYALEKNETFPGKVCIQYAPSFA